MSRIIGSVVINCHSDRKYLSLPATLIQTFYVALTSKFGCCLLLGFKAETSGFSLPLPLVLGGAKVVFCSRVVPFPLKFVRALRLATPWITLLLVSLEFRGNSVGVSYIFICFRQIVHE